MTTTKMQRKNQPFNRGYIGYIGNDKVKVISCEYISTPSNGFWTVKIKVLGNNSLNSIRNVNPWVLKDQPANACKFCAKYPCKCDKLSYNARLKILNLKLKNTDWYTWASDDYSVWASGDRWIKVLNEWASKNFKQFVLDTAWKKYAPKGVSAPKSAK